MVVARPNHVDAIDIDAAHQANLLSLLSMERKDGIEPTNRTYNAIALERRSVEWHTATTGTPRTRSRANAVTRYR